MGKVKNGGIKQTVTFSVLLKMFKNVKSGVVPVPVEFDSESDFIKVIFNNVDVITAGKAKNMKGKIINSIDTNNNKPIGPGSK